MLVGHGTVIPFLSQFYTTQTGCCLGQLFLYEIKKIFLENKYTRCFMTIKDNFLLKLFIFMGSFQAPQRTSRSTVRLENNFMLADFQRLQTIYR